MKRIITVILALTITAGLVSCGKSDSSSQTDESSSKVTSLTVVPMESSKATDDVSEEENTSAPVHTDEHENVPETVIEVTEDKITEDEAKDIVDKALKAYSTFDLENLYKYSDLSYLYSKDGKNISFEDFKKNMQSILDDSNVPDADYDYTLTDAKEDMEMLVILGDSVSPASADFKIDGCWKITSNSEGYGDSSIYLLHINGEWLTDFVFTVYSDFSGVSVSKADEEESVQSNEKE